MDRSLARLRHRLTVYYVASFAAILLLVGGGMYGVTAHEVEQQLVRTLHAATGDAVRAAQVIEAEGVPSHEAAMAAVEEMEVPGSELLLFDARGRPVTPPTAEAPVQAAAVAALRRGSADAAYQGPDGEWRVYARRFVLRGGRTYVAAATSDLGQIEAQSLRLIETFVAGGFLALVLVALIGHRLAALSVQPVENTLQQMRRFLGDAAHELRTPVSVLRGRAEVALQREREPGEYRAALLSVSREAEAMGHIVDDLLTLARVESGVRPVAHEPVYLDDLVSDAVAAAGVAAEARGVRLSVGEFDEAPVLGDATLLRQLLVILVQNAVKYTPHGGEVRVDVHQPAGVPTVVVRDTGMGIPPDELPRVFERFYRGESARAAAEGAGLGLSIARRIAEEHQARIALESQVGRGTRVTVTFPPAPVGGR
ncbi:MAG TPA: HAMP domain-containing sensor histidine kinase [Longimicrobium sp.]|nr:HAMP domain-containing sensor histidine kinase [Longimicrobium sp.]